MKHREIVQELLAWGVEIDAKDMNGDTPLHIAVKNFQGDTLEVVQTLILKGADTNAKNDFGRIPLHYACNIEMGKLLISSGANINAKDDAGKTILNIIEEEWYISKKLSELREYLISQGENGGGNRI